MKKVLLLKQPIQLWLLIILSPTAFATNTILMPPIDIDKNSNSFKPKKINNEKRNGLRSAILQGDKLLPGASGTSGLAACNSLTLQNNLADDLVIDTKHQTNTDIVLDELTNSIVINGYYYDWQSLASIHYLDFWLDLLLKHPKNW